MDNLAEKIYELEKKLFETDRWSVKSIKDALDSEDYLVYYETKNECVIGYVIIKFSKYDSEILRVGTSKEYKRKGIATRLINSGFGELSKKNINEIYLEVRKSNVPAIALYEKLGFRKIGTRKNFYKNPTEDAILMRIDIR